LGKANTGARKGALKRTVAAREREARFRGEVQVARIVRRQPMRSRERQQLRYRRTILMDRSHKLTEQVSRGRAAFSEILPRR